MLNLLGCVFILIGVLCGIFGLYPYIYYLKRILTLKTPETPRELSEYPKISIVINAYKEGGLVSKRIEDIIQTDYPHDKITLYVVNDGADEKTSEAARKSLSICPFTTKLIEPNPRLGKTACQNQVIQLISDEYIVFTDADITTKSNALRKLIDKLAQEDIGSVCADLIPVGKNSSITGSESAYRSIYGKMCIYDSELDSTYNFNGPLIAFKKTALSHVEEKTGADDANLALECIKNGYRAVYASEAVAYELQPISLKEQFTQKIRRADGLINSTRLFATYAKTDRRIFWRKTYRIRKWMLLYSPLFFIGAGLLIFLGILLESMLLGILFLLISVSILLYSLIRPKSIISSFVMNQIFLTVGLIRRKNIITWDRVEK